MKNISIIGSGSWGIALAIHLAKMGNKLKVWSFAKEEADLINNEKKCKFLPERKYGSDLHRHTSSLLFFFRFRHTDGTDDQTGHPSRNENVVLYRTLRSLLSGHS